VILESSPLSHMLSVRCSLVGRPSPRLSSRSGGLGLLLTVDNPDKADDDDDDNNDELESLSGAESVSSVSEVGAKRDPFVSFFKDEEATRAPVLTEEILNSAAQDAIDLLQDFAYKEPMMKLNEYYQLRGINKSITEYFNEVSDHQGKGEKYWRYSFRCPLREEEVSSTLPLALVYGDQNMDDLTELTKNYFGAKHKVHSNLVFFSNKKGAKKSCALAALLRLDNKISKPDHVLVESKDEASISLLQSSDPFQVPKKAAKTLKFPSWTHELQEVGVKQVKISYREHCKEGDAVWRAQYTDLCCILSIFKPKKLTVVSDPYPSRQDARQNAVMKLKEELALPDTQPDPSPFNLSTILEKEAILSCDTQMADYVFPLPPFARHIVSAESKTAYLYEIVILAESGDDPIACTKMSLCRDEISRFGVIFGGDIEPKSEAIDGLEKIPGYSTSFRFSDESTRESFLVMLRKRTVIDLSRLGGSDVSKEDGLIWIKHFNGQIAMWKTYGFDKRGGEAIKGRIHESYSSQLARTYLFVPLQSEDDGQLVRIDWELLREVYTDVSRPFLTPRFKDLELLCISLACPCTALLFIFASLFVLAPNMDYEPLIASWLKIAGELQGYSIMLTGLCFSMAAALQLPVLATISETVNIHFNPLLSGLWSTMADAVQRHYVPIWVALCVISSTSALFVYLRRSRKRTITRNRFLTHQPKEPLVYVSSETINSKLTYLDIATESFRDYHLKKNLRINFPWEKLLLGVAVRKHIDFNPFVKAKPDQLNVTLIPELVRVLPIPRDLIYLLGVADRFMPALEREISLAFACQTLHELGLKTMLNNAASQSADMLSSRLNKEYRKRSLSSLLSEATTLYPLIKYQRMEHLGDAVLGYFLALNLFSRNWSLEWDCEDLLEMFSAACKNTSLSRGALKIGLSRILQAGVLPWRSPFVPIGQQLKKTKTIFTEKNDKLHFGYSNEGQTIEIADSTLSDTVESLLAAVYIHGMGNLGDPTGGGMVVAVLDLLELPMSNGDETDESVSWFRVRGPCLRGGYPFESDVLWQQQLVKIGATLYMIVDKLHTGYEFAVDILSTVTSADATIKYLGHRSKIVLLAALFDDNLDDHNQVARKEASMNFDEASLFMGELYKVALLRDTLFYIGAYALQLQLSAEAFRLYPEATVGDLHLIRTCALTEDVIVYIMMKCNLHKCLFDSAASSLKKFSAAMKLAEDIGRKEWAKNGGWVLEGGVKEFHRRRTACFAPTGRPNAKMEASDPSYFGLAGGRLHGQGGKKLSQEITSDLQFSFKAIVGALVLSIGTEGMWTCIGPLFVSFYSHLN
jgi:dsRNA-specific ribonuclease